MVLMRVSELAERSGVPASTLRHYQERGLLPAQRSPAGYRLYDQRSVERLVLWCGGSGSPSVFRQGEDSGLSSPEWIRAGTGRFWGRAL